MARSVLTTKSREYTFGRIRYKLIRNGHLSQKGKRNVYVASVLNKETYGTDELAEQIVSRGCPLNKSAIKLAIDDLANLISELVAEGRSINIGGVVRFMPVIHGTFNSPNEPFNPQKHKVHVKACVGTKMRGAKNERMPQRLGPTKVPVLKTLLNVGTNSNKAISSGNKFFVFGENLTWNASANDEGWFIIYNGQETKCESINPVEDRFAAVLRTNATFDASGEPLLLIFRTRLGGKVLQQIPYPGPLVTA